MTCPREMGRIFDVEECKEVCEFFKDGKCSLKNEVKK